MALSGLTDKYCQVGSPSAAQHQAGECRPTCVQVAEVGELTEIFQWRGDGVARGLPGFTSDEKRQVGEEMSDVRASKALYHSLHHASCTCCFSRSCPGPMLILCCHIMRKLPDALMRPAHRQAALWRCIMLTQLKLRAMLLHPNSPRFSFVYAGQACFAHICWPAGMQDGSGHASASSFCRTHRVHVRSPC